MGKMKRALTPKDKKRIKKAAENSDKAMVTKTINKRGKAVVFPDQYSRNDMFGPCSQISNTADTPVEI